MKRRVLSFLAGTAAALALTALTATALAASGQVQFNFAGVALNGETKIAAGSDITAPNGQRVPGSILYVDEAGGKTNYLPIRTISELLGVEVGYDSATHAFRTNTLYEFRELPQSTKEKVVGRLERTDNPMVNTQKLENAGIYRTI